MRDAPPVLRSMATRTPPGKKKAPAKKATKAKATKAAKAPKAAKAAATAVAECAPAVKRVKGSTPVRAFKGGGRTLVIVESPTKARTIKSFLPPGHVVLASMGHVRDLPSSAAEIPKAVREAPWSRLGVDVEGGFKPLYVVPAKRKATIKELKAALQQAEAVVIATDEDREGESIGWHLIEVLKPKVPVSRMVFHEITREAIQAALHDARTIDDDLVRAQETRRILDRLVGYTLSPLLWKKIAPKLSAGRVQSVAVRLLVERERERHAFVPGTYWDLQATLARTSDARERFTATLAAVGGRRVATGADFDESTGGLSAGVDALLLDEASARALAERARTRAVARGRAREEAPGPPTVPAVHHQHAAAGGRTESCACRRRRRCASRSRCTRTATSPTSAPTRSTCPRRPSPATRRRSRRATAGRTSARRRGASRPDRARRRRPTRRSARRAATCARWPSCRCPVTRAGCTTSSGSAPWPPRWPTPGSS